MAAPEEIGARYGLELLDINRQQHRSSGCLRINPAGFIPTRVTPDGTTFSESAAMLVYLGDRHPDAKLAPAPDDADAFRTHFRNVTRITSAVATRPAVARALKRHRR